MRIVETGDETLMSLRGDVNGTRDREIKQRDPTTTLGPGVVDTTKNDPKK